MNFDVADSLYDNQKCETFNCKRLYINAQWSWSVSVKKWTIFRLIYIYKAGDYIGEIKQFF